MRNPIVWFLVIMALALIIGLGGGVAAGWLL